VYHGLWHSDHYVACTVCYKAFDMWTQLYTQQLCLLCNAQLMAKQCLGSSTLDKDKLIGVWSGDARQLMHVSY